MFSKTNGMRDIIWTVIGIWLLWRIIDAFRSFSSPARKVRNNPVNNQSSAESHSQNTHAKKGELKPDAGEYIDYEEIK